MNNENRATSELLSELYKNMKMGADSIVNISSKVGEGELRDELARELDTYESFSKKIGMLIYESGEEPKEKDLVSKVASKVGMTMSTLTDTSDSHIAELMIEGANMGITENTKLLNKYKNTDVDEKALQLCRESIKFMQDSIEALKKFL